MTVLAVCTVCVHFARRCGQSSVARRRCTERSELLCPFRYKVVAVGVGGGILCSLVQQRDEGEGTELVCKLENRHLSGVSIEGVPGVPQTRVAELPLIFSLRG